MQLRLQLTTQLYVSVIVGVTSQNVTVSHSWETVLSAQLLILNQVAYLR